MQLRKNVCILLSVLFAGFCWYLGNGLSGGFWWLVWLAPAPIIALSLQLDNRRTYAIAFIAYLIGRLSWLTYLQTVLPFLPAIFFTVILPFIFGWIIIATRLLIKKYPYWWSIFFYPVLFSASEVLFFTISGDGTAGSIAYSQVNFIPLIQVASIVGNIGITFFISIIPSAMAVCWHLRNNRRSIRKMLLAVLIIILADFIPGLIEGKKDNGKELKVGLVVMDENLHRESIHPDFQKENTLSQKYISAIRKMAEQHIGLAVLPEKTFSLDSGSFPGITGQFRQLAHELNISIVMGYTKIIGTTRENRAMVISADGTISADYWKKNLFEGEKLDGFVPGNKPITVNIQQILTAVAICKDLDFDRYIRTYNDNKPQEQSINLMVVPAWDFRLDDWLHSRMAIMRSVENGYPMIRVARLGRLTISTSRGVVIAEANCSDGTATSLIASFNSGSRITLYTKTGDWFSYVIVGTALLLLFMLYPFRKKTL